MHALQTLDSTVESLPVELMQGDTNQSKPARACPEREHHGAVNGGGVNVDGNFTVSPSGKVINIYDFPVQISIRPLPLVSTASRKETAVHHDGGGSQPTRAAQGPCV